MTLTRIGAVVETCIQVEGMRGISIRQGRSSRHWGWAARPAHRLALAAACCLIVLASAAPTASAGINRLRPVSGLSPLPTGCNGAPQTGTLYPNAEVEPHVAVNPANRRNLIAVWQQDRWSTGGANGQLTAYSRDGGRTWRKPSPPPFSRCQGGNAANGGDYERVTDPWVSFGPTGIAYQIALTGNNLFFGRNAILVSRSLDGGATWGPVQTLIVDEGPLLSNDKETLTADPTDPRYVYATWWRSDLRTGCCLGPSLFARSTDKGRTWEPAREIFDPGFGVLNQTIGNQIVVTPRGKLINGFMMITDAAPNMRMALVRSNDKGRTWGPLVTISELGPISSIAIVTDPRDGALVRSGEIIPDFAADPRRRKDRVYAVWQDTRFNEISQIAFSRSDNGGRTWTAPARVNGDPDAQAFTPAVEVNRRGDIAISYYDFTYDTVASNPLETDFWVVRSRDGGRTFTPRRRLTPSSFDLRTAPNARGFFLGDYTGLAAAGNRFDAVFGQTTGVATNPTDLFASRIGAGGRHHGRPPAGGFHPHHARPPHRIPAAPLRRR